MFYPTNSSLFTLLVFAILHGTDAVQSFDLRLLVSRSPSISKRDYFDKFSENLAGGLNGSQSFGDGYAKSPDDMNNGGSIDPTLTLTKGDSDKNDGGAKTIKDARNLQISVREPDPTSSHDGPSTIGNSNKPFYRSGSSTTPNDSSMSHSDTHGSSKTLSTKVCIYSCEFTTTPTIPTTATSWASDPTVTSIGTLCGLLGGVVQACNSKPTGSTQTSTNSQGPIINDLGTTIILPGTTTDAPGPTINIPGPTSYIASPTNHPPRPSSSQILPLTSGGASATIAASSPGTILNSDGLQSTVTTPMVTASFSGQANSSPTETPSSVSFVTQSSLNFANNTTLLTMTSSGQTTTSTKVVPPSSSAPGKYVSPLARIYPGAVIKLNSTELAGMAFISILFSPELNWVFEATNFDASNQIFAYFPSVIRNALGIEQSKVKTLYLQVSVPKTYQGPGNVTQLGITYSAYIPSNQVDTLASAIKSKSSKFYTASSGIAQQLAFRVDAGFALDSLAEDAGSDSSVNVNNDHSCAGSKARQNAIIGVISALVATTVVILGLLIHRFYQRRLELFHRGLHHPAHRAAKSTV